MIEFIKNLNSDDKFHGVLVQLPLPDHIDSQLILSSVNPEKDVDGFHPENLGKLFSGHPEFIPCTPYGVIKLLEYYNIKTTGKHAVIVGRSNIVGKPMAQLLIKESCTVTIAHSKTKDLPGLCKNADIIIAAVGRPKIVKGEWVKEGAIVIDVGINRVEILKDGEKKTVLVGDVEYNEVEQKASAITPVPGGVGPMTIACLLRNTTTAFKNNFLK